MKNELTAALATIEKCREITGCPAGVDLQDWVKRLAAENVALKSFGDTLFGMYKGLEISGGGIHDEQSVVCQQAALDAAMSAFEEIETPATNAAIAGIKADGVEEFLKGSQLPYQIATVLADYDNADDETLHHVIWSGQPPEPDGDVWHLEYVSRGNAIVREVLKQLREGGQMITGTTNYDEVPDVRCTLCSGYYKADEPESHECEEKAQ